MCSSYLQSCCLCVSDGAHDVVLLCVCCIWFLRKLDVASLGLRSLNDRGWVFVGIHFIYYIMVCSDEFVVVCVLYVCFPEMRTDTDHFVCVCLMFVNGL